MTARTCLPTDEELLDCLARGWTRREIAEEFDKEVHAIHTAEGRLRERMGAATSEHMIALYLEKRSIAFRNGYWIYNDAPLTRP